jgi:hypothetical protein
MKFMLMMNVPRGTGVYQITSWKPEEVRAHIDFMHELNKQLKANGEFVVAEGLTPPNEARLVRASKNGGAPVTDGIFPETKEFLVGYWVIDVDTPERAYEVAAKASSAPGPGGAPLNMAIEVRPVMQAPLPGT